MAWRKLLAAATRMLSASAIPAISTVKMRTRNRWMFTGKTAKAGACLIQGVELAMVVRPAG